MFYNYDFEEVKVFDMFLDNTISARISKNGCICNVKLDFIKTIFTAKGITTINLYQDKDKNDYFLQYDYITDTFRLFKKMN